MNIRINSSKSDVPKHYKLKKNIELHIHKENPIKEHNSIIKVHVNNSNLRNKENNSIDIHRLTNGRKLIISKDRLNQRIKLAVNDPSKENRSQTDKSQISHFNNKHTQKLVQSTSEMNPGPTNERKYVIGQAAKEITLNNIEGARDVYDSVQPIVHQANQAYQIAKECYSYQEIMGIRKDRNQQMRQNASNSQDKQKKYYIRGGKRVVEDPKVKVSNSSAKLIHVRMQQSDSKDFNKDRKEYDTAKNNKAQYKYNPYSAKKKQKRQEIKTQYNKMKKQRIAKYFASRVGNQNQTTEQKSSQDSIGSLVKDLVKLKVLRIVRQAVAGLAALAAPIALPIICFGFLILVAVTAWYESPLAIFLPKIEPYEYDVECDDERSPQEVIEEYAQSLDTEISQLCSSYDEYSITYKPEDSYVGSNSKDMLYAYMIKCGEDNDSLVMTKDNKALLKEIFDTMCSYKTKTSTRTVTVEPEKQDTKNTKQSASKKNESDKDTEKSENTTKTITTIKVDVTIKNLNQYIKENPLTEDEEDWYTTLMEEDPNDYCEEEDSNLEGITVDGVPTEIGTKVANLALDKVGCKYSQARRWEENVYDCSSLVYRCYQQYGINLGANTAAGEAKWLTEKNYYFTSSENLQAGDLIFYSNGKENGRYRNISHVAIYIGGGKQVEAQNPSKGVRCNPFRASDINCYARPSLILKENKS